MKTVGYVRVSTDMQAERGTSLEVQAEKIRAMALVQGAELSEIIVESAFREKILDISEAQAETMINPNGIADDFWRKTMTVIAGPIVLHGTSVSVRCPS
jgi:hypothetical protein